MIKNKSVITGLNVIVGGFGNLGSCDFTQADVNFIRMEQDTGGGKASITLPLFESLDVEYKFKSMPTKIFDEMAKYDKAEITAKRTILTGGDEVAEEWVCTGGIEIKYGESKVGEYVDVTVTQKGLMAYYHEQNNKVITDINHNVGKGFHGGVDHFAFAKQSLS